MFLTESVSLVNNRDEDQEKEPRARSEHLRLHVLQSFLHHRYNICSEQHWLWWWTLLLFCF